MMSITVIALSSTVVRSEAGASASCIIGINGFNAVNGVRSVPR
jgi:hypothetical protein